MTEGEIARLVGLEKRHQWHPFTPMQDWCAPGHEPLILVSGDGAVLRDARGREYIDGNASIWTNIHGHNHPRINEAIRRQLAAGAHFSFLGFTHPGAIELGARLVGLWPEATLTRVFFSDDGSTAIEAALKMSLQYWQLCGEPARNRVVAFHNAYHGDTMGAASLGGVSLFTERFARFHFPVERVGSAGELAGLAEPGRIAAVVIEPGIQGVNGMRPWPRGLLGDVRSWCDRTGALLIADEVMTGFGRTGAMFASQLEEVTPDLIALAKGLSGGYLPVAATLVRERIYEAFLGGLEERRTFYYGHSYTANALGCAAALASLDVFEEEKVMERLGAKIEQFRALLAGLEASPHVGEIRQLGLIAGIELMHDPDAGIAYDWREQVGARVCMAAREHGLLTRPIGDVVVLMPPLCIDLQQLEKMVGALFTAVEQVCGSGTSI